MTNYFRKPDALVDAVNAVLSGQPVQEKMDPVDQKALKGKHSDRKDKDIDNDGDVDSSDEYLHKRRKAVSKAMKEEVELDEKVAAYDKNGKVVGLYRNMADAKRLKPNHTYKIHKEETEDNPANTQHLCAKNVVHESWGEGSCIPTMHADPDEDGNIEWYDVMFDHGIEEQVSIEELKVTKAESHIHSSKKKIKDSDDEDDDDDDDDDDMEDDEDDSDEDEENGKKKKVSGKKDDVDVEPEMDDTKMVTEKEMTPAQEKKREEIVLSMKKEMPRFKKKYGDRAKDVMYATATKMAMREGFELGIEKSDLIEEVELDEAKIAKKVPAKDGGHFVVLHRDTSGMRGTQDKFHMRHLKNGKVKDYGTHPSMDGALKFAKNRGIIEEVELDEAKVTKKMIDDLEDRNEHGMVALKLAQAYGTAAEVKKVQDINKRHNQRGHIEHKDQKERDVIIRKYYKMAEEVELDEAKSGTGYDLYHKDFSSAMQHAYDHAKKKHGITINPKEIDDKVASGPRKPSEGKTNTYRLKGDKGAIQVQVYNKGGSKPFELNMYKEEVSLMSAVEEQLAKIKGNTPGDQGRRGAVEDDIERAEKKGDKKLVKKLKEDDLGEGFINIGGAKVKDDEKSILQHIKKTFPNVKKVKKDPRHGWIPVFEELDLDEGRGRPRKDGTTGGSEDRENIQMQLRKSVSLRGLKDVEFADGKKVKVPAKVAQGVMSKINSIKDAKQKQNAVQHIAKSHKHMMDFHKGDYKDADAKRQDILKLK
jgi:hypothetical protein